MTDRPIFAIVEQQKAARAESISKATSDNLSGGTFDTLFEGASHTPSELFRQTQKSYPGPSVELSSSSPFLPTAYEVPIYPALARLAHVAGQVNFTLDVGADGATSNIKVVTGHVMLQKAVESTVASWKFPKEAVGKEIRAALEFKMNCLPSHQ